MLTMERALSGVGGLVATLCLVSCTGGTVATPAPPVQEPVATFLDEPPTDPAALLAQVLRLQGFVHPVSSEDTAGNASLTAACARLERITNAARNLNLSVRTQTTLGSAARYCMKDPGKSKSLLKQLVETGVS